MLGLSWETGIHPQQQRNVSNSHATVPKSVGHKGNFGNFWSLNNGCVSLTDKFWFPTRDLRSRLNRCQVISRWSQHNYKSPIKSCDNKKNTAGNYSVTFATATLQLTCAVLRIWALFSRASLHQTKTDSADQHSCDLPVYPTDWHFPSSWPAVPAETL